MRLYGRLSWSQGHGGPSAGVYIEAEVAEHEGDALKPMLRVMIADDEPLARQYLRRMLEKHADVTVVGEAANGIATLEGIRRLQPDVLMLDVQMPGMSGFQVIQEVRPDRMPRVIFVTAYDHYAVKAFEVHAIDYLLKPFNEARLAEALARARERFQRSRSADDARSLVRLLESVQRAGRQAEKLQIRAGGRMLLLPLSEIHLLEAEGKIVRVVAATGQYTVRQALGSLEQRLSPEEFIRVSRSTIVNVNSIREVQRGSRGEYLLILRNGDRVQTTRSYRGAVAEFLGPEGE